MTDGKTVAPIDEINISFTIGEKETKIDARDHLLSKFLTLHRFSEAEDEEPLTDVEKLQLGKLEAHIKESFTSLSMEELRDLFI